MKVGAIETQWDRIPAVAEYCGIGDFKTISVCKAVLSSDDV